MPKHRDSTNSILSKQSFKSCTSVRSKAKQTVKKQTAAKASQNLSSKRVHQIARKPIVIEIEKVKLIEPV